MNTSKSKHYPTSRKGKVLTESLQIPKQVVGIMAIITAFTLGFLVICNIAFGQNVKTYIPPQAFDLRDDLYNEIVDMIPQLPEYNYVPALIEHESCISLKHSKCWNPTSTLSNKREHSVGFFQIAKAYDSNGNVRMDTLTGLKNKYKTRLADLTWENIAQRPDLQMRAGIALIHDNWQYFHTVSDPWERLAFTDAGYNGGPGNVNKERRACGLKDGCDPQKWFGNVETTCVRNKKPIAAYGGRSICTISRDHVSDVLYNRIPKYKEQYFNEEYLESR